MWHSQLQLGAVLFAHRLVALEAREVPETAPLRAEQPASCSNSEEPPQKGASLLQGLMAANKVHVPSLTTAKLPLHRAGRGANQSAQVDAEADGHSAGAATVSLASLDAVRRSLTARAESGSLFWVLGGVVLFVGFAFCIFCVVSYADDPLVERQDQCIPSTINVRLRAKKEVTVSRVDATSGLSTPLHPGASLASDCPTPLQTADDVAGIAAAEESGRLPTLALVPVGREPELGPGADDPDGPHLCPALVVPEDSECTLLVPLITPGHSGKTITICDSHGVPIFKANFGTIPSGPGELSNEKRAVLSNPILDTVFAFCRDARVDKESGMRELEICYETEKPFGMLRADGPRFASGYSVAARGGWRIRFRGGPDGRNLNATDEHGRLLAMTEVNGQRRSIRIGPLVDAGLIVLAMLGISILQNEMPALQ